MSLSYAHDGQKCVLKQKPFDNFVPRTVFIFPWTASYEVERAGEYRRFIMWDAEYGWVVASCSLGNWEGALNPAKHLRGFAVVTRTTARPIAYQYAFCGQSLGRQERSWCEQQKDLITAALNAINGVMPSEERAKVIAAAVMPEPQPWMLARENLAKSLAFEAKAQTYSQHSPQWQKVADDCQQSEVFVGWQEKDFERQSGERTFILYRKTGGACQIKLYPLKAADFVDEVKAFQGRDFKLMRQVEFSRSTGKVLKVYTTHAVAP